MKSIGSRKQNSRRGNRSLSRMQQIPKYGLPKNRSDMQSIHQFTVHPLCSYATQYYVCWLHILHKSVRCIRGGAKPLLKTLHTHKCSTESSMSTLASHASTQLNRLKLIISNPFTHFRFFFFCATIRPTYACGFSLYLAIIRYLTAVSLPAFPYQHLCVVVYLHACT